MKPTVATLRQLIGNPDVYAVQTAKGAWYPVKEPLTNAVLKEHLDKKRTIGTYVNKGELAKTLVFDIDEDNKAVVEDFIEALEIIGFPRNRIAVEFSGNKGYHIWLVAGTYLPAAMLRRVGRAVCAVVGHVVEVFPKQDYVKDLGSLIKLPCGKHQVSGKENNFIEGWPQPIATEIFERISKQVPERKGPKRYAESPLQCLATIQQGIDNGWRNNGLFQLATMLRRGGLSDEWVAEVVAKTAAKCNPPVDDEEVEQLLESSKTAGPICDRLPEEVRCPDCPIRREKGLYLKAGQLKHGAEGEMVVVELGVRRSDGAVTLIHPDLEAGLVKPKG